MTDVSQKHRNFPTIESLYIKGRRNLNDFKITFNQDLNIIVGPNGVGKSTLLDLLYRILTGEPYTGLVSFPEEEIMVVCTFLEITLDDNFIKLLNPTLSSGLARYNEEITEENIYQKINEISKKLPLIPIDNKTFSYIKIDDITNQKIRIVMPVYKSKLQPSLNPTGNDQGFFICNNKLYITYAFSRAAILKFWKEKVLTFNVLDNEYNLRTYVSSLEKKEQLASKFTKLQKDATKTFNQLSKSNDQKFEYSTLPKMEIKITNEDGKKIDQLSSGERQLEQLKLFTKIKKELDPLLVLIDEPEVHLNYGQLAYLSDLITSLTENNCQIIIATHSPYFIRSAFYKSIRYLRFDKSDNPIQIILPKEGTNYLQYPDIFFAEKVIIVEGYADSIFYQRTLDILLKEKNRKTLSSLNIQVIPTSGKFGIKNLVNFTNKKIGLKSLVIADLDFLLDEQVYNFINQDKLNNIRELASKVIKTDLNKAIIQFKDMPTSQATSFVEFLKSIFKRKKINLKDLKQYEEYSKLFSGNIYQKTFIGKFHISKIRTIFKKENIWLLTHEKLENYVKDSLKKNGKVSVDKLNEIFYPENKVDLKKDINEKYLNELENLADYIYEQFS